MGRLPDIDADLARLDPLPHPMIARARRAVAQRATDVDDLRELLGMLGLLNPSPSTAPDANVVTLANPGGRALQ